MQAEPESNPSRRRPPYGIYAYTGREWDPEINLYYYRARYYDPRIGRFISEDPIRLRGGPNLYAYVLNRPVRSRDPFGLCPPDKCIIYEIVRCEWCTCTAYEVPSVLCPEGLEMPPPVDVSPKYWMCDPSHFEGTNPIEYQISPQIVPGNPPRDRTPGDGVNKIPPDPDIKVEDIE